MKRIKQFLKSKKGDGYIDVVVAVLVSMMLIVIALNVFQFFVLKQDIDYFAKELIETATANGSTMGEVNHRYYELCDETGIYPGYSFSESDYMSGSYYKVQLGDTITVKLTYTTYVKGVGVFKIPVTLTASYSGLSKYYWK
jgi:hypothetical protein